MDLVVRNRFSASAIASRVPAAGAFEVGGQAQNLRILPGADCRGLRVFQRLRVAEHEPTLEGVGSELAVLDNIWDNLFPAEQQRLVRMVIQQATLFTDRLELTLRGEGMQSVVDLLLHEGGAETTTTNRGATGGGATISIPIRFKRRSGRREIILPPDPDASSGAPANQTFLLALARAFRWKDLLESGRYSSIKALAADVGIERSYLAKLLNLTLLAPRIIEAVIVGDEPDGLSLSAMRRGIPVRWDQQSDHPSA